MPAMARNTGFASRPIKVLPRAFAPFARPVKTFVAAFPPAPSDSSDSPKALLRPNAPLRLSA